MNTLVITPLFADDETLSINYTTNDYNYLQDGLNSVCN